MADATVTGLHHVTLLASSAARTDAFLRDDLGLARVKRTVNADRPDTHHLFYGDGAGTPGTLVTVHAFANLPRGEPGVGEIAEPALAVGVGALQEWRQRFLDADWAVEPVVRRFGRNRLVVEGPDGERLAFQVEPSEQRIPRPGPFDGRQGIRGLHSVTLRVRDAAAAAAMLEVLGYAEQEREDHMTRHVAPAPGARAIDVAELPDAPPARHGAGSVHHAAFAVPDGEALDRMHEAVRRAGFETTEIAGRIWFDSFHFRGPDGLLFEVATEGPGMTADEAPAQLGQSLALPAGLEGERETIERRLEPLEG